MGGQGGLSRWTSCFRVREPCWLNLFAVLLCLNGVAGIYPGLDWNFFPRVDFLGYNEFPTRVLLRGERMESPLWIQSWCRISVYSEDLTTTNELVANDCDFADYGGPTAMSYFQFVNDSSTGKHGAIVSTQNGNFTFYPIASDGTIGSGEWIRKTSAYYSPDDSLESYVDFRWVSRFTIDDEGWYWAWVGSWDGSYSTYSLYAMDSSDVFYSGHFFNAIGGKWFIRPATMDVYSNGNYSFIPLSAESIMIQISNGEPHYDSVLDVTFPFTVEEKRIGAGFRLGVDYPSGPGQLFEAGGYFFMTRYFRDSSFLSRDDVLTIELYAQTSLSFLSAIVVDDFGYYAYVGDTYGYVYKVALDALGEVDRGEIYSTFDDFGVYYMVEALSFHVESLSLFAVTDGRFDGNEYYLARVDVEECSTYSTGSTCLQDGGRYCVWNTTGHNCYASNQAHEVQSLPSLSSVSPDSVAFSGGTKIQINGTFYDNSIPFLCGFAYPSSAIPSKFSPVTPVGSLNVNGSSSILDCVVPPLDDIVPSGSIVGLSILYADGVIYSEDVLDLEVHSCAISDVVQCATTSDCGLCLPLYNCTSHKVCDVMGMLWTGNSVPTIASLTPNAGPIDVGGVVDIEVVLDPPFVFFAQTEGYVWAYFGDLSGSPVQVPVNMSKAPLGLVKAPQATLSPMPVNIFGDIASGRTQVSFAAVRYHGYDCSEAKDCASCIVSSRLHCRWCSYSLTCAGVGNCPLGDEVPTCPTITSITPSKWPERSEELLTLVVDDLPTGPALVSLNCHGSYDNGTHIVVVTTNATYDDASETVSCLAPPLPAGSQLVAVSQNETVMIPPFPVSVYDCSTSDRCSDCYSVGTECGWCLEKAHCTIVSDCPVTPYMGQWWITDTSDCPVLESVYPFSGATDGLTSVWVEVVDSPPLNATATWIPEGESVSQAAYGCKFGSEIAEGEYVSGTTVRCDTPGRNASGFVDLDLMYKGNVFTQNSISFVFVDCSSQESCYDCVGIGGLADCGWCIVNSSCTNRKHCEFYGAEYFVQERNDCPTSAIIELSDPELLTNTPQLVIFQTSLVVPDATFALRGEDAEGGENAQSPRWEMKIGTEDIIVPCDPISNDKLRCWTVPGLSPGQKVVTLMYLGKPFTSGSRVTFVNQLPIETYSAGDPGPIIALLLAIGGFFHVLLMTLIILKGRKKPVIVVASPSTCYVMLFGGVVAVIACFFFIWRPTQSVCRTRPWFFSVAATLIFGPLYAKTFRMWRIFRNPKLRRVKLKKKTMFLWVWALLGVDILFLIIWTSVAPYDAQLVVNRQEDALVYRCRSTYSGVFEVMIYVYKGAIVLVGSILALMTRNIKSEFNESRYIGMSMYSVLVAAGIMIPLLWFGDVAEQFRPTVMVVAILLVMICPLSFVFVPKCVRIVLRRTGLGGERSHTGSGSKESLSDLMLKAQRGGVSEETFIEEGVEGYSDEDFVSGSETTTTTSGGSESGEDEGTEVDSLSGEKDGATDADEPDVGSGGATKAVEPSDNYFSFWNQEMDAVDGGKKVTEPVASSGSVGVKKGGPLAAFVKAKEEDSSATKSSDNYFAFWNQEMDAIDGSAKKEPATPPPAKLVKKGGPLVAAAAAVREQKSSDNYFSFWNQEMDAIDSGRGSSMPSEAAKASASPGVQKGGPLVQAAAEARSRKHDQRETYLGYWNQEMEALEKKGAIKQSRKAGSSNPIRPRNLAEAAEEVRKSRAESPQLMESPSGDEGSSENVSRSLSSIESSLPSASVSVSSGRSSSFAKSSSFSSSVPSDSGSDSDSDEGGSSEEAEVLQLM